MTDETLRDKVERTQGRERERVASALGGPRLADGIVWPAEPEVGPSSPSDGVPNMRHMLPPAEFERLTREIVEVLRSAAKLNMDESTRAALVATWVAPQLAEQDARIRDLQGDLDDARFDLNRALHAAVVEPGVPLEGEVRRALRVHGVSEDRELDACVVAVRRTLASLTSELAGQLADERLRVEQAGAALACQVAEVQRLSQLARGRHAAAQRLREELAAALLDADRYRGLTPQLCPADNAHTGWFAPSGGRLHRCPWCQILELGGYVGHVEHVLVSDVASPEPLVEDPERCPGRTVVELPPPDGTSYEGDPIWSAHVDYEETIFACVDKAGHPVVEGPFSEGPMSAATAEMFGLRLIAAAHESRRRAVEQSPGGAS